MANSRQRRNPSADPDEDADRSATIGPIRARTSPAGGADVVAPVHIHLHGDDLRQALGIAKRELLGAAGTRENPRQQDDRDATATRLVPVGQKDPDIEYLDCPDCGTPMAVSCDSILVQCPHCGSEQMVVHDDDDKANQDARSRNKSRSGR